MLKRTIISLIIIGCSLFIALPAQADWVAQSHPQFNENYDRLQQALDYYQRLQAYNWPHISIEPLMKGGTNPAVPELRERLRFTQDLAETESTQSEVYDAALMEAVKRFQWRHGLKADGVLGGKTLREMNVSPYERAEEIRRNMTRWAALPPELGNRFIFINIPEYSFDLVENGQSVLSMKVIVGKPERPTPELNSILTQVELNPYWNIPPMIAKKDIIPKILKDQRYLDQMHIHVVQRRKDEVIDLDPSRIDWEAASRHGFAYDLRQEPGPNNSLGLIKFDFANQYDVYMHDTPAKELFNKDLRIFSSGCIRLEKPFALLAFLLNGDPEWDLHEVAKALQSGELTYIKVKPLPIYVIYATAWVDENSLLHFTRDPYHYNEDPNPDDLSNEAKIDDPFAIPLSFYA